MAIVIHRSLRASAAFLIFAFVYAYVASGYYLNVVRAHDLCWVMSQMPARDCI